MRAQVAGYKVKCMIAEPKGKRGRVDAHYADQLQAVQQASAPFETRMTGTCLPRLCTGHPCALHPHARLAPGP